MQAMDALQEAIGAARQLLAMFTAFGSQPA
jgi:hypothetical protein